MKKALILCFDANCDDYPTLMLESLSPDVRYGLAKDGVEKGTADIYTLDDFCQDINYGQDCLTEYLTFPMYVEDEEYKQWSK